MEQLRTRLDALAGRRFVDIATELNVVTPPDLKRHKGWVGNLMELALGADAASRDEPDFTRLGIELKTIPINRRGRPCETTFVCTIPLHRVGEEEWEQSRVRCKLAHVLWLIIEGDRDIPLPERRVGAGLFWRPSAEQEAALKRDWEQLAGIIGRGDIESIMAHLGEVMQVRPKAASASVRRRVINVEGELTETMPRGFYLRTAFTGAIIREHFIMTRAR